MTGSTSGPALGAVLGLAAALGSLLVLNRVPPLRRPTLDDRLAPYLREAPRGSRLLRADRTVTPFPTLERIFGPLLARTARRLEAVSVGAPACGGGWIGRRTP